MSDLVRQLGALAFASRLKRLSDRLYRDVSRVYEDNALAVEARWFPIFYLLTQHKEMGVTDISRELGLTHPAINQFAGAMTKRGLLESHQDPTDDRRRLLSLSTEGRRKAKELQPIWEAVRRETETLLEQTGGDMLTTLDRVEAELDREDMHRRVKRAMNREFLSQVEIVDYKPSLKKYFESLNREWLEEYFEVEPPDEEILSDPKTHILSAGGQIFFARRGKQVIGTAAMIPVENGFELTKMAVTGPVRGRGVGRELAVAALAWAREQGAEIVLLHTSRKLKPALALYKSLGFGETRDKNKEASGYKRRTITMELKI